MSPALREDTQAVDPKQSQEPPDFESLRDGNHSGAIVGPRSWTFQQRTYTTSEVQCSPLKPGSVDLSLSALAQAVYIPRGTPPSSSSYCDSSECVSCGRHFSSCNDDVLNLEHAPLAQELVSYYKHGNVAFLRLLDKDMRTRLLLTEAAEAAEAADCAKDDQAIWKAVQEFSERMESLGKPFDDSAASASSATPDESSESDPNETEDEDWECLPRYEPVLPAVPWTSPATARAASSTHNMQLRDRPTMSSNASAARSSTARKRVVRGRTIVVSNKPPENPHGRALLWRRG
ncbi:hypothetical protein L226DRAFT_520354 [Lentinus tigrinus ALCF2SS1-7]|nr:hypothetical protein L226DRAFT_520354 [Lentinus tigrinus ALCF2SS1-7]